MAITLKMDIISRAYSLLRISGLTRIPSPSALELALVTLESLAHELNGRNICTGYNIKDDPDPNEAALVKPEHVYSLACVLVKRLLSDFGKPITNELMMECKAQWSFLYTSTLKRRIAQYPDRMPVGEANTARFGSRWFRFYHPIAEAPNDCDTKTMIVGDTNDFTESFASYLRDTEDLASYTIEFDAGLDVTGDAITSTLREIDYTVEALGASDSTTTNSLQQIIIVATTTESRVTTRLINFKLAEVEL